MRASNTGYRSGVTEIEDLAVGPFREDTAPTAPGAPVSAGRSRARISRPRVRWVTFGLFALVVVVAAVVTFVTGTLLKASAAERSNARMGAASLALAQTNPQRTHNLSSDTNRQPTGASEAILSAATTSGPNSAQANNASTGPAISAASRGTGNAPQVLSVPDWTNMVVSYPKYDQAALRAPVEEFPVFPGATLSTGDKAIRDNSRSDLAMIATMSASAHTGYMAPGSVDEVVLFYEQALPRHGWTPAGVQVLPSSKGNGTRKELSYTWSDGTGAFPYNMTIRLAVEEMSVGTVSISVSVQREPSLRQMPLYPGAVNVQTTEQIRSQARNSTSYYTRTYRVVSYAVHASEREVQTFYMDFLSRYLYAGVQHSASEIWFLYDYPTNPQFGLKLSTRAEKGGMTSVDLSTPLSGSESAQP